MSRKEFEQGGVGGSRRRPRGNADTKKVAVRADDLRAAGARLDVEADLHTVLARAQPGVHRTMPAASCSRAETGAINNSWMRMMAASGDRSTPPMGGMSFCKGASTGRDRA